MGDPDTLGCTVVICDDTPGIRMLLRAMIGAMTGFSVVGEAANGREAIDLAAQLEPDLMLLDVSMPVMDGIEAVPFILSASPATTIVVLSAFSSPEVKERALAAGAVEYVEKGTSITSITEVVTRHGAGT